MAVRFGKYSVLTVIVVLAYVIFEHVMQSDDTTSDNSKYVSNHVITFVSLLFLKASVLSIRGCVYQILSSNSFHCFSYKCIFMASDDWYAARQNLQ